MEESHRTRYGERVWSIYALSGHVTLPAPPCVQPSSSSPKPLWLGFLFISVLWRLHHVGMIDKIIVY